MKKYYSNGKLLITGEYLVLNGAKSLALPTQFGQELSISKIENPIITWKSIDFDESEWFSTKLYFDDIIRNVDFEQEDPIKNTLVEILHQAYVQNPDWLSTHQGYSITTRLTFPRNWGLGTSSTLINNIAQWLEIDAFELLRKSFGGSGYDVACAQNNTPIIYQLIEEQPSVEAVYFNPKFKEHIYFVYLNQKQNSRNAIQNYMNKQLFLEKEMEQINSITQNCLTVSNLDDFCFLLQKHEVILSNILETSTVQERLFSDFKGVVKSLGAWGGDFVLVVSKENPVSYFNSKGFKTILKYKDMILSV